MKIAIMGAGSVGCYYGGMLARQGCDVMLIGRPAHVDAIDRQGLRLQSQAFDALVPLRASTEAAAVAGADLVLCCVKSLDTAAAAHAMAPHLAGATRILSLQNGVDNLDTLQAILPQTVAPAVVYVATEMAGPGHVVHHGRGELVVPPGLLTGAEHAVFAAAGIPLELSDNVVGALWFKLILNCAFNAISAITQRPYGELWPAPGVRDSVKVLVDECLTVAKAEGVVLPADPWPSVEGIAASMPGQRSSTAQDLARGKPTEIDYLNGAIVRRGQAHGIATPANLMLHTLVRNLQAP